MNGLQDDSVYKICGEAEWRAARKAGVYRGNEDDARDGFVHLSSAEQVAGTLAKHYAGRMDLVLVEIDGEALGPALKWERSRSGALFPHLYAALPLSAVRRVAPLASAANAS